MQGHAQTAEKDIEVRREDQERINEFGKNANHIQSWTDEQKELQKKLDLLEDAEQEALLNDDPDELAIKIGTVFVSVNEEEFTEFIEEQRHKLTERQAKLSEEITQVEERQSTLKSQLYGRFGNNIQLESGPSE